MIEYADDLYKSALRFNLPRINMTSDNNILWITGLPGSGKSTLARYMAGEDGVVVELDYFVQLLETAGIRESDERYWSCVDSIREQLVKIGQELYTQGRILVVEGIQIYRKWLTGDVKGFFQGQPLVILKTDRELAIKRLMIRNNEDITNKDRVSWFRDRFVEEEKYLSEFVKEVGE